MKSTIPVSPRSMNAIERARNSLSKAQDEVSRPAFLRVSAFGDYCGGLARLRMNPAAIRPKKTTTRPIEFVTPKEAAPPAEVIR